jgi:hypothetical protein
MKALRISETSVAVPQKATLVSLFIEFRATLLVLIVA